MQWTRLILDEWGCTYLEKLLEEEGTEYVDMQTLLSIFDALQIEDTRAGALSLYIRSL